MTAPYAKAAAKTADARARNDAKGIGSGTRIRLRLPSAERRPKGVIGTGSGIVSVHRAVDAMHGIALGVGDLRDAALDLLMAEPERGSFRRSPKLVRAGDRARTLRGCQFGDDLITALRARRPVRFPADSLFTNMAPLLAKAGALTDNSNAARIRAFEFIFDTPCNEG